jgi:iron complex outermembrane receptor protein
LTKKIQTERKVTVKILLTILATGLTLASNTPVLLAQDGESEAASAALTLEEVIVTAQRREQNLQDVPMSISSFDGDMLKEVGIPSFQQLADITPSLTVTNQTTWTGGVNIYLRGQGGGAFNRDPAVGIYINEAYVSDATSILNTFLDVERVETLIGPQGTLWGRNTMAGAMNIVLKGPTEEFETVF